MALRGLRQRLRGGSDEAAHYVTGLMVRTVVLISRPGADLRPHFQILRQFLRSRPEVWRQVPGSAAESGAPDVAVLLYRRVTPVSEALARDIRLAKTYAGLSAIADRARTALLVGIDLKSLAEKHADLIYSYSSAFA